MKRIVFVLLLFVAFGAFAFDELPSPRNKTYRGFYYFLSEEGDSTLMLVLNDVTVFPPEKFKDKEAEQFYWRMVRDVRKGLPYAKLISATVIETYEYISTLPTKKEREDYLKEMEKEVFNQYKPELKRFSRQQARVLVKLVNRETNQRSTVQRQLESRLETGNGRYRCHDQPYCHANRTRHIIIVFFVFSKKIIIF